MTKYFKRMIKYFSKHQQFADVVHAVGGVGLGIILARPLAGEHPVRWGLAFLLLALIGHWWAATR